jgi:hypothetical protein
MERALAMTAAPTPKQGFDFSSDAVAIAVVLATVLVSALCCAFLLSAGIVIAE